MRKKSIIVVLLAVLMSLVAVACSGGKYKFDEYTDFTGEDISAKLELDDDMTLDGVLDEEAWINVSETNKMSVTSSAVHKTTPDKALSMDVYTHFGEKALYFAFDVTDNSIFVEKSRKQSRNTGVELYISALDQTTFSEGCVSIRVTPQENGTDPIIGYYIPSSGEWFSTKVKGKYAAATNVDGKINEEDGANGYVVELALSYDLIGGKTDSAQYAAAFVQSPDLGNDRLANTFLKGTNYLSPASWIGVTENGTLTSAEKNAYLDENIEVDSDMNIDGKLDDAKWQEVITAGKGKTITHTKTGISLTTYTLFSDKGVYIGLDSNDKEVWYNADRKAKYNTGAEIFISALGQTELTSSTAVQIRFNVGGGSVRYNAEPTWEYPWNQGYFQAKMAGSVKNNGELNKAVDTENGYTGVDGWQGEIFIPWSVFGATTEEEKSQINVFDCIYTSRGDADYANDTEAGADGWNYLAPAGITVYGNGSGSVDPTKSFFKFTKADGFVYGGVEVPDVVFYESNGNYQATLSPKYIDAVTSDAFTTETKLTTGGTFTVDGISSDSFVGNADGTYTLSLSEIDALKLENGKTATFTTADGVSTEFNLEYYNVDASKFDTSKLVSYLNFNGTAETILGSATSYVDRGTPVYTTYGTGAVNNSYLAANQKNSAIKVKSSVGTGSFVMSVLAKGSDIKQYATDAHIADNTKPSGYAFVLFGTDNVDGKVGFTVRVRMDAIQVRIAGNTNFHNDALTSLSDDWQRWTFVVDRETEGKLTYMLYLDETKIAEKTINFDSATSLDVAGTVGIGAPGSTAENGYTDKSIGLDDFVYATGTYSFYDLLDMFAWTNEANTKYAFDTDDITFDFTDVTTAGYTQQINVVAYPSDGSAIANVTDVTFGSEIASYITRGESDNFFTLTIPADKLADFKNGVKTTYTYNGASRTINVKYNALDQLYLDKTSFSSWKSGKTGTNYVFTVGVYGISDLTGPLTEVTFSDWTDYVVDNNDGTYTFTVPATVVEALTEPKTITASKGEGVGTADFTFEYLYLTDSELSALANATEAYYDFNGNVIDKIQGTETKAVKGSVTYNADNDALKVTCGKDASTASTLGAAISLGTESFTMSLDVKLNTKDFTGADASYEIISSGVDITKNASTDTFHFAATGGKSAANGQGNIRIQVGDNYIGCYYGSADGKVKLDQWQRYTIVVERGLACDDETKETVKTTLYMDGVFVQSRTRTIPKGSVLGNGTIYFGGSTTWSSRSSEIDNFTFVRKAMTAREVAALDSYYTEICAKVGWYVDNYTFDFTDITEGSAYTGTINFTTNGTGAITTGATFTGLPDGVTITENTGVYTLNVPADKLSSLKGGVAVTAKIGDVERSFKITYIPLEKLYLDKSAVSMWSAEATGDNYNFSIKVYADEAKTFALDNVTFSDWNNYATFDTTNKVYNFAVPTSVVDALTEAKTITASRGEGVETADFTFTHNVLTDSEVNALAASTKAYIDFDGTITDKLGGNTFVNYGTVAYGNGTKYTGDQYFAANQHNTSIKLSEKVGTDSFTMSIMVNGDDVKNYASSGYSFILFGTGNVDGKTGFSVRVRSNALQVKFLGNRYDPSNQNSLVAALSGWQRWTFVVDRETEGKLTATLYIDSTNVYTKTIDFASTTSLDVDGYNTIGIGSVGTTYDYAWTSYTDKTIGLDDFVLVNRAITAREVAALDSYYTEISNLAGWKVNDVSIDFKSVTKDQDKTVNLEVVKCSTGAVTTGATFTGLPDGVTITESNGSYTLTIPYAKLDSFKNGVTVTAKVGSIEKSFKITYIPLENIYASALNFNEYEIDAGVAVTRTVKVTADTEGTVGLAGATFSGYPAGVTVVESSTAGEYTFTVPADKISDLVKSTVTASYEGKSTTVSVNNNAALLKDTNVYNCISTSGSSTVQGGQVLTGGDFGTDSFTVAMMAKGLNTCQNGGGFVLFSNGQADAYKGVSVYLNISDGNMGFRFRFPGMSNSSLKIGYDISKLTDWTHLAFTFDRSDASKVVITAYVNYTAVGSVTQAVTSGTSFSFGENKFIIGAYNSAAYESTSIATYSYNLSAAGATVYRGVAPISAIQTYFDSLNLSLTYNEEVAKFTFADGATTNSVSGSSVTMTLSSGATETIKEGKDTATVTDDKAITLNSTSAYYDVNGFDVSTCSFMVSMDLKMDFSAALSTGGGKVLFATTNGSANTGLAVSIKQNTLRIRINGTTKFIAIDTDNNLNKWTNISIAFIRFNGKCRIVVLVNNAYAGREETAIANNVSLAGADNYLGIGRGTTSSDYENVSHTVDNIVLTKIN